MDDEAIRDPELRLALGYAPQRVRNGLETLFALDARLAGIVARTREPTIGLMRLVWWRDALEALDTAPPPGEPLLVACAAVGVPGFDLAAMVAGWESLLDDPELGPEALATQAVERGARLFSLAAGLLGDPDPRLAAAGEGWALVDLARHVESGDRAAAIFQGAVRPLATACGRPWPRALRPLGQLAALAYDDARRGTMAPSGTRRRLLRILRFHLTGR
jgi:15-cis-phytoene synthase